MGTGAESGWTQRRLAWAGIALKPRLASALALVGLLAGCSQPDPEGATRLLDRIDEAVYSPDVSRLDRVDLLAAPLGPSDWRPLLRLESPSPPQELERFRASSAIDADGFEFGSVRGSWLTTLALEGSAAEVMEIEDWGVETGGAVFLRATASFEGPLRGDKPRVTVSVAELSSDPGPGRESELAAALIAVHTTEAADGRKRVKDLTLEFELDVRTRALAVLCTQERNVESEHRVRLDGLELYRPGFLEAVEAETRSCRRTLTLGEAPRGRFLIGMISRPGVALAQDDRLEIPLAVPAQGGRLQGWLGVPSHALVPDGTTLYAELSLSSRTAGPPIDLGLYELETAALPDRRWLPFDVELPRALHGSEAVLTVAIEGTSENAFFDSSLAPVVLAAPRVIPGQPRRPGPNVVLISVDTLRPDHMSSYGYERPTSPNMDRLAAEGLVFEDVWAQGPYTLPAHMSMHTGQHPSVHGALRDPGGVDPVRTTLMAELFARAGYATAGFVAGGYLHVDFGFAPGFDTYSLIDPVWNRESERIRTFVEDHEALSWELADGTTMATVTDWVADHAEEPFFLFLHTYAAHEFDPPLAHREALDLDVGSLDEEHDALLWLNPLLERPPTVTVEHRGALNDLYDAAIHQADEAVGALLDALDALGLSDDTVVVLTSDHGKEIADHGSVGHGHTLYEELLQVPLIVRSPGLDPGRSARPAMLIDVLPTIAGLAGLETPPAVQGLDLLSPAFLEGRTPDRTLWAEVDAAAHKYARRDGPRKTIWSPLDSDVSLLNKRAEETYDLARDPGEQDPFPEDLERIEAVRAFRDALEEYAESLGGTGRSGSAMSSGTRELLEALGYAVED